MPDTRWFQLVEDHDVAPDGTPRPLASFATVLNIPTMVGGDIVGVAQEVRLEQAGSLKQGTAGRIVPDSRVAEVADPVLANALTGHPLFVEIDKPTKTALAAQAKETGKDEENAAALREIAAEQEQAINEDQGA